MSILSDGNYSLKVEIVKSEYEVYETVDDLIEFAPEDGEFVQYEYIEAEDATTLEWTGDGTKEKLIAVQHAVQSQNVDQGEKSFTIKLKADQQILSDQEFRCSNKECLQGNLSFETQDELDQHNVIHLQQIAINQCLICNKNLASRNKLTTHMETQHIPKSFECDNCGKTFRSKDNLRLHMSHHRKYFQVQCKACSKTYKSMQSLRYHLRQHFEHHQCETCGIVFEHKKLLISHITAKHKQDLMLQCRFCTRMFSRNDVRDAHEREIHKNGQVGSHFKCHECDFAADLREDLMNHRILLHYTGVVHKCACGKIFKKKSLLDLHKNSHKEKSIQCDSCKMMFTFITALKKHIKLGRCKGPPSDSGKDSLTKEQIARIAKQQLEEITVNPNKKSASVDLFQEIKEENVKIEPTVYKIPCIVIKTSGRKKKQPASVKPIKATADIAVEKPPKSAINIRTITDAEMVNMYQTKYNAGVTYSSSGRPIKRKFAPYFPSFIKQVNILKRSNVPYECDICGATLDTKLRLMSHLSNHLRILKHKCEVCEKSFANLANVKKHCAVAHPDNNPFKLKRFECSLCPKRYHTEFLLRQHKLSHENQKNQKCSMCPFATNAPYDLKNHIKRIHHATKDYLCPEEGCGKAFKRRCDMENHRKTVHTNVKVYVKCPICEVIVLEKGLQSHMINQHTEKAKQKPFVCQVCGRAERYEKNLQRHYEAVHEPVDRGVIYACPECPQAFFRRRDLTAHSFEHFTGIVYKCQECSNKYKTKKELTNHLYSHKCKEFPCPVCNVVFKTKSGRAKHLKAHVKQEAST